tara:strand:- start:61 stop:954 length:894 start_codon:yes stop_codon:yes gene_type:complete
MPEEQKIEIGDSEESSIDVTLEDSDKEVDEVEQVTQEPIAAKEESPEELEDYSDGVKKRIAKLTKKYREEERQKKASIEFAENVRKENEVLKSRLDSLDAGFVKEADTRIASQIDTAKRILKDAHESNDVDKMVEAQEVLASLAVEKDKVSSAQRKRELQSSETETQPQAETQPQNQPQVPAKPDPRAQQWAESNSWFGQDDVMTYAAFGVHNKLVDDEGFDPSSEEYYAELDKRLLTEFPTKLGQKNLTGGSRKVASAEASASRNKGGRKSVKLTPSQVAIAKKLNVPLEEYAKYV